jgi:DNA polymerase III subunit gamma/tau
LSRTALARTYRPRSFAAVSSQEHVSQTLRAAVRRDRVAHAYLFCGPRGVGKTTLARVLAMALNCPRRTEEGEPCGSCESCERIWSGRTSLDVIEIDAASNRGVDDARELRERAMYAPSEEDRFKVYIIDEAHMLTREAWNALLKILEEPPPRVIFVFATTEPQKIQQQAAPILSRCQRFDFRRVGTREILARMREVLGAEGYAADDTTLLPIAQKADGGMRDALSLLDQVLSFTEGAPTAEDVRRVLGLVGTEMYLELADIIADRRHAEVFRFVGELMDSGYDLAEFYRGLADFLRTLLVARLDGVQAVEVGEDMAAGVEAAAQRFEVGDLLRMLAQVAELDADGRFRKSGQPRILIELLLLRFSFLDRTVDLERLLAGLGGSPAASTGGDGGGGAGKAARPPEELPRRARPRSEEAKTAGPAGGNAAIAPDAPAAAVAPPPPAPGGASSPEAGAQAPAPPPRPRRRPLRPTARRSLRGWPGRAPGGAGASRGCVSGGCDGPAAGVGHNAEEADRPAPGHADPPAGGPPRGGGGGAGSHRRTGGFAGGGAARCHRGDARPRGRPRRGAWQDGAHHPGHACSGGRERCRSRPPDHRRECPGRPPPAAGRGGTASCSGGRSVGP